MLLITLIKIITFYEHILPQLCLILNIRLFLNYSYANEGVILNEKQSIKILMDVFINHKNRNRTVNMTSSAQKRISLD